MPNVFDRIQEADATECRAALRDLGHLKAALDRVLLAASACEGVLTPLQDQVAGEVEDTLANLGLDALARALDERLTHLEARDAA